MLGLAACGDDDAAAATVPGDSGRVAVGPPIGVEEALTAAVDRPHLVTGYLFGYADGTMVLADARPPDGG